MDRWTKPAVVLSRVRLRAGLDRPARRHGVAGGGGGHLRGGHAVVHEVVRVALELGRRVRGEEGDVRDARGGDGGMEVGRRGIRIGKVSV